MNKSFEVNPIICQVMASTDVNELPCTYLPAGRAMFLVTPQLLGESTSLRKATLILPQVKRNSTGLCSLKMQELLGLF